MFAPRVHSVKTTLFHLCVISSTGFLAKEAALLTSPFLFEEKHLTNYT